MTRARTWAAVAVLLGAVGCNGDGSESAQTTTTPSPSTTTESAPLDAALVTAADLPGTFVVEPEADPTVTTICAGQDAAQGLTASARAVVQLRREPAGASVVQLVIRFEDDGAVRFVDRARELLGGCENVPDLAGLAFEYEPPPGEIEALLDRGSDDHVAQRMRSVGSGNYVIDLAIFRVGNVGELVASLAVGAAPEGLTEAAVRAALERL